MNYTKSTPLVPLLYERRGRKRKEGLARCWKPCKKSPLIPLFQRGTKTLIMNYDFKKWHRLPFIKGEREGFCTAPFLDAPQI